MKCEYVEPIRSETLIKEFEDCVNYTFPQSFKDFIIHTVSMSNHSTASTSDVCNTTSTIISDNTEKRS